MYVRKCALGVPYATAFCARRGQSQAPPLVALLAWRQYSDRVVARPLIIPPMVVCACRSYAPPLCAHVRIYEDTKSKIYVEESLRSKSKDSRSVE